MNNQIFVKINEYNEVLKIMQIVKEKIAKTEETIKKLSDLKEEEINELSDWSKKIETVKNNVEEMEKQLSQTKEA
jgi:predicted  nucleic acid-binding Zn-ribbon protein|tara:strand:- start:398 stop:622 length:225 start_codon:yes stop_codon:yes gene_type:complete